MSLYLVHYAQHSYKIGFLYQQVNLEYLARVAFTNSDIVYPDSVVGTGKAMIVLMYMYYNLRLLMYYFVDQQIINRGSVFYLMTSHRVYKK
jgi:hypothetical protein